MTLTILIGYLLIFIAIDFKRPKENRISKNTKDWWVYIITIFAIYLISFINTFIIFLGYFIILIIVDYHRPKENRFKLFTKNWFVLILLLTIGSILINTKII